MNLIPVISGLGLTSRTSSVTRRKEKLYQQNGGRDPNKEKYLRGEVVKWSKD